MKGLRQILHVVLCLVVVALCVGLSSANGQETGDGTENTVTETEGGPTNPAKDKKGDALNVVTGGVKQGQCSCSVDLSIKKATPEGGKFKWSKVAGPGNVTFDPNNTTKTSTTMAATKGGKYKVKVVYTVGKETTDDKTNEFWVIKNTKRGGKKHKLNGAGGCGPKEEKDMDEKSDKCGNTLTLRCEGLYVARYNGKQILWCRWADGRNTWFYWKTRFDCRFHSGYSGNWDRQGKGEGHKDEEDRKKWTTKAGVFYGDEGKVGTKKNPKYDFWWYKWDFINGKFTQTHYYGPRYGMQPWDEGVVEVDE